jgi:hypothetical protein
MYASIWKLVKKDGDMRKYDFLPLEPYAHLISSSEVSDLGLSGLFELFASSGQLCWAADIFDDHLKGEFLP